MRSTANKNHEGYHDPTASQALGRVKRQGEQPKIRRLVYQIGEVVDFSEILVKYNSRKKMMKGNQRTP